MVKVDIGGMSSQSSSVSGVVTQEVTALTAGMTALNRFLSTDSLKGVAYDNAKSYASNVLLPLIQAVILYVESVSEKTHSLGTLYASYSDESLDSEVLEAQIRSYENSWRSANASYQLLLQDSGSGPSSVQGLLAGMDSMQEEIRKLREKLRNLHAFDRSSSQTFSDTASLEGTLLTAFQQVKQDFGSYTAGKGFPSYNKKNLAWTQGVENKWGKRQKVIEDYKGVVRKSKNGQDLTEDDIRAVKKYMAHFPGTQIDELILKEINYQQNGYSLATEEQMEIMGYKLVSEGKIWVDEEGKLHTDGSAEAASYLVNLETVTDFKIAGVTFNSSGKVYVGGKAAADFKSELSKKGFDVTAFAEVSAVAKASRENGFEVGEGILSLKGSQKIEAIAGAWAIAESDIKINKYGLKATMEAEAKAGVEVTSQSSLTTLNDKVEVRISGDAFAGAKAGVDSELSLGIDGIKVKAGGSAFAGAEANVEESLKVSGVTLTVGKGVKKGIGGEFETGVDITSTHFAAEVDLGIALGVGPDVEASLKIDYQEVQQDIEDFISWINPLD